MKRLILIFVLFGLLLPSAYGRTISHTFANGDTYVGEVKNGKMNGQGTYTYASGDKYVGEWKNGGFHGQGTFTWVDGRKYVGEYKDDKMHGQGTHTWADGNQYVGGYKDGNQHGQGTYTWASGAKYVGGYKDDKFHGQGTYTYPDGTQYVGNFKDKAFSGHGTLMGPDGKSYVGEFKDGMPNGQGTYTFGKGEFEGNNYVGEWKDGLQHGRGTYTYVNGEKYVGEYKADKKHGNGIWTHPDGDKYVGEFKDGKAHGKGTFTFFNGDVYVGEWKDGKQNGQGTRTWADGAKEVGEYKYANYWNGTQYNASGEIIGKQLDGMPAPACNGNQEGGLGTGFAVNQYHVVTNAHVLYCCKKVIVHDLSCSNEAEAAVVSTEQRSDLGLLHLDRPLKHYATLRSGNELELGEAVTTYDSRPEWDDCSQYDVEQAKVTKLNWMPDDSRLMVHDSRTREGSSGGPVLDMSGQVVGVTQSYLQTSNRRVMDVSFAVKPHLLKAFLKSNNVEYNTAPSVQKLSLSEIKKKSDKFTVIIDCVR